jgi:hypothetical protein
MIPSGKEGSDCTAVQDGGKRGAGGGAEIALAAEREMPQNRRLKTIQMKISGAESQEEGSEV